MLIKRNSGYNPPDFIRDAAKVAIDRLDCNQYAPTKGRPRLKEALSSMYSPHWGRKLDPNSEITITTGANEGMLILGNLESVEGELGSFSNQFHLKGMLSVFMSFIEQGDEVIIFEPYFDQSVSPILTYVIHCLTPFHRYLENIRMPGGVIKCVPLHPPARGDSETCSSSEWTLDIADFEAAITPRTKMVVINTPHNPIGKIFSREELQKIGDICVQRRIMILSDEVYDSLDYVPFTRIATLSPEIQRLTLTVGSAGKHFFCTGWRVGWVIGPAELIDYVAFAHTKICYCTPSPLQEGAAVAYEQSLTNGFWSQTKAEMRAKMDRFCEVFKELGIPYTDPEGGYFVLANLAKVKLPADYVFPEHVKSRRRDFKLAWFLIMELGVAAIPPTEFYTPEHEHLGEQYMRFAVCKNDDVLDMAKERLRGLKAYI